jgi:hypothetical protein
MVRIPHAYYKLLATSSKEYSSRAGLESYFSRQQNQMSITRMALVNCYNTVVSITVACL